MVHKADERKSQLIEAYSKPLKKFCYYTGKNDQMISKRLGLKYWDWTPNQCVNIEPYFWNTHTIPLTFGCKPVFTSERKEWIQKIISSPEQVQDIQVPDVYTGRTGEILNIALKLVDDLPEDYQIRLPDIQSPLGVAELMWDDSFYMALLTNPDEIHQLLEKISRFIVSYVNEIKKILGKRYNPSCHPQIWSDSDGYYISDDVNSMVSPEMHDEYSIQYINRLTEELGPVHYHSCTWTDQYLDNIDKIKNKKAVNWSTGTSADPAILLERYSGKTLICPHIGKGTHLEEGITKLNKSITDEVELIRYYLDNMQENTTMYMWLHDDLFDDSDMMIKIYELFHSYGYSPQSQKIHFVDRH